MEFDNNPDSQLKISINENDISTSCNNRMRDNWGKDIEFLMSCIALSVGLGNVWRFPFTAYDNGGGAFVVPYIIVLIFIGKPVYYLEMILGQFSSRGSIKVYDFSPSLRGVGYGQVFGTAVVTTYYASLMALAIRYFIYSFNDELPWAKCRDEWNVTCIDSSSASYSNLSVGNAVSSAELFFM